MSTNGTDLTNCDREPIHTPGSVQAHGCLIACSADGARILRCSENAVAMLGLTVSPLDLTLGDVFEEALVHDLFNAATKSSDPRRPGLLRAVVLPVGTLFDVSVHRFEGAMIIEFEPASAQSREDPLDIVRALMAKVHALTDMKALNDRLPRYLQGLLGYDRVMIYEFAADGSGKVVGEAKRGDLESFLGQHFPAADIPKQARSLYLKNTIRVIGDATGAASTILPVSEEMRAPLDLSFAHLRSVSPIHLEYLRNMGVGASMSISIIVGGELWGLIACHHYAPKILPLAQRVGAELFGDFFSLHLTSLHHRHRAEATVRVRAALDQLLARMSFHQDVDATIRDALPDLAKVIACDGIGLWLDGEWSAWGSTPPTSAIAGLADFASAPSTPAVVATHALYEHWPEARAFADVTAGVLAVPLSITPRDFLFFFRKEKVQTLEWAGDPNKVYSTGPNGDRLTPRQSFAVWKQSVEGQSDPWTDDERNVAEALLIGLREVIMRNVEILAAERQKAEIRQRVLNDELNHRVKNILALIKSLVSHPAEAGLSLERFVEGLKGRILALSHAHDQVVRADGGGSLHQLLRAELSPYPAEQVSIAGNDVGLDARAYSVMALVLHELATNAAKYGALSVADGRLRVETGLDAADDCWMTWGERSGPPVEPPQRQGFGSVLLGRSVPFDLQGSAELDYRREGLQARFTIPARFASATLPVVASTVAATPSPSDTDDFANLSVLLLEDQLVIALDAEAILQDMGVPRVATHATVEDALRGIAGGAPDIGILDVNLGDGTSLPVAEELARRGVPFVFATGYGDSVMIPEAMRSVPVVRKPYSAETLRSALMQIAGR
ncbi:HWE histidine kinase domain-containing protein [uncultured Alsobacter sp.]|uniref:HWE histidine kinase domain-containing protein n=1 Tax=uncultured Alsobacter sp. TaxID=1748258 RepID=UPI0025DEF97B|nr:HWE histidine kinase domain-containing protein [uncultured Alsobacter sp.]